MYNRDKMKHLCNTMHKAGKKATIREKNLPLLSIFFVNVFEDFFTVIDENTHSTLWDKI